MVTRTTRAVMLGGQQVIVPIDIHPTGRATSGDPAWTVTQPDAADPEYIVIAPSGLRSSRSGPRTQQGYDNISNAQRQRWDRAKGGKPTGYDD